MGRNNNTANNNQYDIYGITSQNVNNFLLQTKRVMKAMMEPISAMTDVVIRLEERAVDRADKHFLMFNDQRMSAYQCLTHKTH